MMKNIRSLIIGVGILMSGMILGSCSDDDVVLSGSDIEAFSISGIEGVAQIDKYAREVYLQVPASFLSGKQIVPVFTLSEGASMTLRDEEMVSSATMVDFSTPVTCYVRAEDGTSFPWKVTLSNSDNSVAWGLGYFVSEEKSNEGTRPEGWYQSQFNSGPQSNNNCGPAVATMAARWVDPDFSKTVQDARNTIPYGGNGGVNWIPSDINQYLFRNNIRSCTLEQLPSGSLPDAELREKFSAQVRGYVNDGKIAILCLKMSYVSYDQAQSPDCRVGRFYDREFDHFLIVKGYKEVDGKLYFEVMDPWDAMIKYEDGTSKGMNRYYLSDELSKTSRHNANVVVVSLQ